VASASLLLIGLCFYQFLEHERAVLPVQTEQVRPRNSGQTTIRGAAGPSTFFLVDLIFWGNSWRKRLDTRNEDVSILIGVYISAPELNPDSKLHGKARRLSDQRVFALSGASQFSLPQAVAIKDGSDSGVVRTLRVRTELSFFILSGSQRD